MNHDIDAAKLPRRGLYHGTNPLRVTHIGEEWDCLAARSTNALGNLLTQVLCLNGIDDKYCPRTCQFFCSCPTDIACAASDNSHLAFEFIHQIGHRLSFRFGFRTAVLYRPDELTYRLQSRCSHDKPAERREHHGYVERSGYSAI